MPAATSDSKVEISQSRSNNKLLTLSWCELFPFSLTMISSVWVVCQNIFRKNLRKYSAATYWRYALVKIKVKIAL
jgi:hypothetical protein